MVSLGLRQVFRLDGARGGADNAEDVAVGEISPRSGNH